jgi:hypothetical protein
MARILFLIVLLAACQGQEKKGREEFPAGNMSFVSISDMNDAHFELRKDGSFEYYRLLFDSLKNSTISGTWKKQADTILLIYNDTASEKILGPKAMINQQKHEISFFDSGPGNSLIMVEK